jgi:hypothetical protein
MLFDQHPRCIKHAAVVITLVGVEHRQRQLIQLVSVVVRQDALFFSVMTRPATVAEAESATAPADRIEPSSLNGFLRG